MHASGGAAHHCVCKPQDQVFKCRLPLKRVIISTRTSPALALQAIQGLRLDAKCCQPGCLQNGLDRLWPASLSFMTQKD
jgi:hypothetical protein